MAVAAWNRRVPGVGVPVEDAWWLFQTKRAVR